MCPQTINSIYNVWQNNFADLYDYFEINYFQDQEYNFIQNYQLRAPLSIVLQNVNNGVMTNWVKIDNPQTGYLPSPIYKERLISDINNFFGHIPSF